MGSFSHLTIDSHPMFYIKNWYFSELVDLIFLPEDYKEEVRKFRYLNKIYKVKAYDNEDDTYIFKGFRQTAKVCKSRLSIYGYTLKKAQKDFQQAKKIARVEGDYDFPIGKVNYQQYLSAIKAILRNELDHSDYILQSLCKSFEGGDWAIYGQSIAGILYSILSILPDDSIIELDLTDVIDGGHLSKEQAKLISYEKILILTEGKTDKDFISSAMMKLYPYLVAYYHFIDFEEYKVESNASALVKLVTSFAASNIKHPIIVLFDNDTTGIMEMNKLKSVNLGSNFKILKFPDLKIAKKYPTVGPTGKKKMNINGLACGIELYLGKGILTKGTELIPIQWKAYNEKEKKYQGEIQEKNYVQEKFREKIKFNLSTDLDDLDMIMKEIFDAFRN
ncbi:MAG: hypothetical protein KGZ82_10125 [Bacteroidales bacterium]|nr:hypothetical protein [Bacteroidales bacterium]